VLLVAIAATLGWVVGDQTAAKTKTVVAPAQTTMPPAGHMGGPNLPIAQIGDPARGARLWQSKRCSGCHSYGGRGGEDAPPLDFMRGHMSAREIADMSGQIWDHLPAMLPHFREEKIPVPTFTQGEMADLIAFLHSGKGAKTGAPPAHPGMTGMSGMGAHMGATRGKEVFLSAGCGACHILAAAGTKATVRPEPRHEAEGKEQRLRAGIDSRSGRDDRGRLSGRRDADQLPQPTDDAADRRPRRISCKASEVVARTRVAHAAVRSHPAAVNPVCRAPDADAHEAAVARPQPGPGIASADLGDPAAELVPI